MGQTKCCWGHGPAAWMHHKDLPLPGFFTLLQNKLSLGCFDSVPRLSCPLGLTQKWLAALGSRCSPGPAYPVQHFLNSGGVFLPQALVLFACFPLQLFPHPLLHSCILPSTASPVPSTLSSPQFHTVQQHKPQKLPVPQCCSCPSDLCSAHDPPSCQQPCPRVCIALPKLCDLQPTSCISSSKIPPVHSPFWQWCIHGSSWVQAFPQLCGLRAHGTAALGFAKPELLLQAPL